MIVNTSEGKRYILDLELILESVRKYNMRLNPPKCYFEVQVGKLPGFMLTIRGIEENPYKFQSIIIMRSPSSVKLVQQLTRCLVTLVHFLSRAGDKAFKFFATSKKKEDFKWKGECDQAFSNLNAFLVFPPILIRLVIGLPFSLFLFVIDQATSNVLVHEKNKVEQPIYFVSKVFKGANLEALLGGGGKFEET